MAKATFTKQPNPIIIDTFLGDNESVGETEIGLGEAVYSQNFRITKNYKPKKRPGHRVLIDFGNTSKVQGIWQGDLGSGPVLLVAQGGALYEYDISVTTEVTDISQLITDGVVTNLGAITDAPTYMLYFIDGVYVRNGVEYKVYDGSTFEDVPAYRPIVSINAPPTGGGTLFEEDNMYGGLKAQQFQGDGTADDFVLAESGLDSIDYVKVNDVDATSFTPDLTGGKVTAVVPVPSDNAIVEIGFTKENAANNSIILGHKYLYDYGVGNDTNLFTWGNADEKATFRTSGINKPGYYPANAFTNVGNTEFALTDLVSQYKKLYAFKENQTMLVTPTANQEFNNNPGLNPYEFPYEDLNEAVGNIAPNMVQLVENNPVSLYKYSMWSWASSTQVEDERSAKVISDRLKLSLEGLDLSRAVTFDNQRQKELWVCVGDVVYIWNYGNDTMYRFTNIKAYNFDEFEKTVFFGSDGGVNMTSEDYEADGQELGDDIHCILKLGFNDLGLLNMEKSMSQEWLAIDPAARTSVTVKFVTDRRTEAQAKSKTVSYVLLNFNDIDFTDFSFKTNANPQPKRVKKKVRKFTYLQTIFENKSNNEALTVLKLVLPVQANRLSG